MHAAKKKALKKKQAIATQIMVAEELEKECSICFQSIKNESNFNPCTNSHNSFMFHQNCIKAWLAKNPTCPCCRTLISTETLNQLDIKIPKPTCCEHLILMSQQFWNFVFQHYRSY